LTALVPRQAALAISDLLDNCARIEPGQHVLIVAALDGLHGGENIVDEQAIAWVQAGVQQRGAYANVLWLDMPTRPARILDSAGKVDGWRLPPILKAALSSADVFINHCVDLSFEEELKEVPELLAEYKVPMVRNMATTAALLASAWALTPYELVSEIRIRAADDLKPGAHWTITHPNGSHLEGTLGPPPPNQQTYAEPRTSYRPFPEGVLPRFPITDAEGEMIINATNPIWARHIGIPSQFSQPVHVTMQGGMIKDFQGGPEAEQLRDFYATLFRNFGEGVYRVRLMHGGTHPHAHAHPDQCPSPGYRTFIEHHNWRSMHVHLGDARQAREFVYNTHVTAELSGATVQVGDAYLWKDGHLVSADAPSVQAIAKRYPDRPGLDDDAW